MTAFAMVSAWALVYLANAVVTVMHEFGHRARHQAIRRTGPPNGACPLPAFPGGIHGHVRGLGVQQEPAPDRRQPRGDLRRVVRACRMRAALGVRRPARDLRRSELRAAARTAGTDHLQPQSVPPFGRLLAIERPDAHPPNLRPRALRTLLALLSGHRRSAPVVASTEERAFLVVYGILSVAFAVGGLVVGALVIDGLARRVLCRGTPTPSPLFSESSWVCWPCSPTHGATPRPCAGKYSSKAVHMLSGRETLSLDGVGVRLGGFVLSGVTFAVGPGEVVGLVGHNGSGKEHDLPYHCRLDPAHIGLDHPGRPRPSCR